jgi:hypothetical protein
MQLFQITKRLSVALSLCLSSHVFAATDSVTRDLKTGDWVFTVTNPETNAQKVWRFVPRNQFIPRVRNTVYWNGSQFTYRYALRNDKSSKQSISYMWITNADMNMPNTPRMVEGQTFSSDSAHLDEITRNRKLFDTYIAKYISSPKDWRGRISIGIGKTLNSSEFGWFVYPNSPETTEIAPGKSLQGTFIVRPELPGAGLADMQGATEERGRAGDLPDTGPLADAWDEIEANDTLHLPVMVPAITIPHPYNGAELAKRIKAHVATWLKLGLITQDTLDRLNRGFDSLIAAQTYNNIAGTRAAVREILQEAYGHHRGLSHNKHEADDDEHDAEPIKRKAPTTAPLNRVAARALSFDLTYLLTRAYIGK